MIPGYTSTSKKKQEII
ncbi:hypothetical protein Goshw_029319 [Gossypium schwendimanii]|uniref:Uncharacterized protein n=1 Tax=Gossypium schwendimanii TaxID=34291 RepID=A0A7J9LSD8_GOSSC|nr:hypothetical protein [Gossypium schwendimanii]